MISMTALIPILLPLKFLKVTLKLFKPVKATKFGYKIFQKVKKMLTTYFSIFWKEDKLVVRLKRISSQHVYGSCCFIIFAFSLLGSMN